MNARLLVFTLIFVVLIGVVAYVFRGEGDPVLRPVKELRVRIPSTATVPEPTNIQSTGDWYYLYHLSSGLAHYDSA